jgi:predicted GNAT family acetyltransferase
MFGRRSAGVADIALEFVRHADAAAFLDAAAPLLQKNKAANSGFVAWAMNFVRNSGPPEENVLLATIQQQGRPVGIALRRDGGPLILGESSAASAVLSADALAEEVPDLNSIVGALEPCEAFARVWLQRTGRAHMMRFHLRDYALTTMPASVMIPGVARLATEDDAAWLGDWLVAFVADAKVTDDPQKTRSMVPKRIAEGRFWLWEHDGAKAMLGAFEIDQSTARIAPVYTPPQHRRRGYASALVSGVSRTFLQHGKRTVYLTTDLANTTSNNIYLRIGFEAVGDQYQFDLVAK